VVVHLAGPSTMKTAYTVKQISPMLAVADMTETLRFYSEVLGFNIYAESEDYSIIERNGFPIHLIKAADAAVMEAVRGHTEIYIEVSDIESLWKHVQTFRDKYKIRDLFNRSYGMTEFHLGDPNGCLIFVGERTANISKTN
jgi:catechol 2,3-dioxygenase-like lactoylglutathione lyase family enzyme